MSDRIDAILARENTLKYHAKQRQLELDNILAAEEKYSEVITDLYKDIKEKSLNGGFSTEIFLDSANWSDQDVYCLMTYLDVIGYTVTKYEVVPKTDKLYKRLINSLRKNKPNLIGLIISWDSDDLSVDLMKQYEPHEKLKQKAIDVNSGFRIE